MKKKSIAVLFSLSLMLNPCLNFLDDFPSGGKVLASTPSNIGEINNHYRQGSQLMNEKNYSGAIAAFEKGLAIDTRKYKTALVHALISQCYYKMKDYNKSIETGKKALQISPAATAAYISMASCYMDMKDYDNVIKCATNYIESELDPGIIPYEFRSGAYLQTKQYEKAIADFDIILKLDPSNKGARVGKQTALDAMKSPLFQ